MKENDGDDGSTKCSMNIVTVKIVQILSVCMQSFYEFFNQRFMRVQSNTHGRLRSMLSTTTKREKSELTKLIEKILHVFKISLNLMQGKGTTEQSAIMQEKQTMKMLLE